MLDQHELGDMSLFILCFVVALFKLLNAEVSLYNLNFYMNSNALSLYRKDLACEEGRHYNRCL